MDHPFHQELFRRDPQLYQGILQEQRRQQNSLELIASENFVSPWVRQAQGSVLTNKYAEGYPGKRYYGGCEAIDHVERLAKERAQALFKCKFSNVQPHSGSQANQGVFFALLTLGDTILSLALDAGGHLSHGANVSVTKKLFQIAHYPLDPHTQRIDTSQVEALAEKYRPKMIIAGGSAYPRHIDFAFFRRVADKVGAYLLVDMAHFAGLVASGHHPPPFPHAHVVTSTTHKTLRGPRGGLILTSDPEIAKKVDKAIFPGLQGGPLPHVIAGKAACFQEALAPEFQKYGKAVVDNAKSLEKSLARGGLPLVSGGTDTHLLLLDLSTWGLSGQEGEKILESAGMTCNKNAVPQDPRPPKETSGLRLGSGALTTRGLGQKEFSLMGEWIIDLLKNPSEDTIHKVREKTASLCQEFPLENKGWFPEI